MQTLWEIWLLIVRAVPMVLSHPTYLMIIGLVLYIVYAQYRKVYHFEKRMLGLVRKTPLQHLAVSLAYGILGGIGATFLFILIGISVLDLGILYLWLVAVVLMLFSPRLFCFAYAGGLVSLSYLIFGVPQVDVAAIMVLVAILHLAEAVLIFLYGHTEATPIYLKHKSGRIVGGFSMQKFWPLPFVALTAVFLPELDLGATVPMPDWWPLIEPKTTVPAGMVLAYSLFPVMAALGYGDYAVTSLPRSKARRTAGYLLLFSTTLLALGLLATSVPQLVWATALFAPLGHEWVIYQGRKGEDAKPPVFTADNGMMVLAVYPGSAAEKMGLGPGDIIRSVNGTSVSNYQELGEQIQPWLIDPEIVVENPVTGGARRTIQFKGKIPPLGIIPAPDGKQRVFMQMKPSLIRKGIQWVQQYLRRNAQ